MSAPGAAFDLFGPFVLLSATATIDHGEPVTVWQQVDLNAWRRIEADPPLRADFERRMRYDLGIALADRLNPTITVHEPPSPGGPVSDALARADAAMGGEPEPEHCRPLELGSEG
ncbi:hypothetical protein ACIBAC_00715 [Streptomyces sp. NPDC051362]|uniref:hypothetical protein n=1 Tax=Streptomyces sp. NPDC051362 TaxID=3365651 RepID=UPI0037BCA1F4